MLILFLIMINIIVNISVFKIKELNLFLGFQEVQVHELFSKNKLFYGLMVDIFFKHKSNF